MMHLSDPTRANIHVPMLANTSLNCELPPEFGPYGPSRPVMVSFHDDPCVD